jgi:hypothetical protein
LRRLEAEKPIESLRKLVWEFKCLRLDCEKLCASLWRRVKLYERFDVLLGRWPCPFTSTRVWLTM